MTQSAERAYVMTRTRRLSRESEAWARLLHTELLPSLGLPPYLQQRVSIDTTALPRPAPQPAGALALLIRSESEEDEEGEAATDAADDSMMEVVEDSIMGLGVSFSGKPSHSRSSSTSHSHSHSLGLSRGHSQKQEGRKVQEAEGATDSEGEGEGYHGSGGKASASSGGEWYAAPEPLTPDMVRPFFFLPCCAVLCSYG